MSTLITGLVLSTVAMAWFGGLSSKTDKESLNGEIGLRGYFYAGDGSEQKPFEIVTPTHFYNLTRLQNLGIFPEKKYFQVGHQFDSGFGCIDGVDEHGDPNIVQYLDMSDISNSSTKLLPIGGEGAPFVGDFDGHGIPIQNLKISGYPEDIGVFGYVAHEGRVKGLVCDNLEVVSLGYNNTSGDADNELFGADIDDIFDANSHYFATQTKLDFYKQAGDSYTKYELKKLNGASGTHFDHIDASENLDSGRYFKGYFEPTYPVVQNDRFTYGWKSSSKTIKLVNNKIVMDLKPLEESEDFNSNADMQVDARLSLIASVEIEGFVYSRVIQSYVCEFYSNSATDFGDGDYSVSIFCDYAEQEGDTGRNTHYHHGVNIGFLAGHVDGTIIESYVYNSRFKFNETGYHAINTESQTGLVGEIGTNVVNEIEADISQTEHGDTGIMNFSKIYSLIRNNMTGGATVNGGKRAIIGTTSYKNYVSYSNYLNAENYEKFSQYLRKSDSNPAEFITYTDRDTGTGAWHSVSVPSTVPDTFNSVDFLWNNVIEDEPLIDRGLGVFKIVTSKNDTAAASVGTDGYGDYMVANIGDCRIVNTTPKSKVYFSTAEWNKAKGGGTFNAARQTTIPSYCDALSFEYPFSRDFNYCFELDLSQMEAAGGKDYMHNTQSDFLAGYLSTVLRDKRNDPILPGSPRFGFMFRSSENEQLTSLSSYMPVGKPGEKAQYGVDSEGHARYYPANSIVFRIDNERGANVSVVANGRDVGIYRYDPTTPSVSAADDTELILKMKNSDANTADAHRYFTYDVSDGATGDTAVIPASGSMADGGSTLYGHIFHLPQGDYVIGSSADSGDSNIYFLAVQGQTDASIGADDVEDIGVAITDVDFLTDTPLYNDYAINASHSGLKLALFSFESDYNMVTGTFIVQTATKNNKKYIHVTFGSGFVTHLALYSRHLEHTYKVVNSWVDNTHYEYPNPLTP